MRDRTAVREQVPSGVYMLREVVRFNPGFAQPAKLHRASLEDSFRGEAPAEYSCIRVILQNPDYPASSGEAARLSRGVKTLGYC